jgi:hypothetical protein
VAVQKPEAPERVKLLAYAPYVLGAGAIIVGVGLGLRGPPASESSPVETASSVTADAPPATTSAPTTTPPSEPSPPGYDPDLSGEAIGELVVAEGVGAHGLARLGKRLVWLETEHARLASVAATGGEVKVLFAEEDAARYGGAFSATAKDLVWSVGDFSGGPHTLHRLRAADVTAAGGEVQTIASAGSVERIVRDGDALYVVESGRVVHLGEEGRVMAEVEGRIVDATRCDGRLHWLEAPLTGGPGALFALDEGGPTRRAKLAASSRDALHCHGDQLVWSEEGDTPHLTLLKAGASTPRKWHASGLVTAAVTTGAATIWAELHGEGDDAVSLLRQASISGGDPTRIGRVDGTVTALAVHESELYWAADGGLFRHRLAP